MVTFFCHRQFRQAALSLVGLPPSMAALSVIIAASFLVSDSVMVNDMMRPAICMATQYKVVQHVLSVKIVVTNINSHLLCTITLTCHHFLQLAPSRSSCSSLPITSNRHDIVQPLAHMQSQGPLQPVSNLARRVQLKSNVLLSKSPRLRAEQALPSLPLQLFARS